MPTFPAAQASRIWPSSQTGRVAPAAQSGRVAPAAQPGRVLPQNESEEPEPLDFHAVLNLSGTTNYYQATDATVMDIADVGDAFTVAFRMAFNGSAGDTIIAKKAQTVATEPGWRISISSSGGNISVSVADGTLSASFTGSSVVTTGLKSIVAAWDGNYWAVWVDGVAQTLTPVHDATIAASPSNALPVQFGRIGSTTGRYAGWLFDVVMDDTRAWDSSDVAEYGTVTHVWQRTDLRTTMTSPLPYYLPVQPTDGATADVGTIENLGTNSDLTMLAKSTAGNEIKTGEGAWATGWSVDLDTNENITTGRTLPSGAWSVAWWHYSEATSGDVGGVGTYGAAGSTSLLEAATRKIRIRIRDSGSGDMNIVSTAACFTATTWAHVLVTHDGSCTAAGVKVYVNDSLVAMTTVTNTATGNVAGTFLIGAVGGANPSANLCEVAVWSSDVSASHTAIYNAATRANRLGVSPAPDVLYFPILSTDNAAKNAGSFFDLLNGYMVRADNSTSDDLENVSP